MHFLFWSRCCCCLSFFLLAALLLLLVLVVLTTSVLKQREVPATVFSFYVSVPYTAMLGTSADAVVLGCFLFCPLDCDNPIMVVDCAAVETGCMLETQVKVASKNLFYFFSLVYVMLLCVLLLPTTVLKRKEVHTTVSFFYVSALYTATLRTSIDAVVLGCYYFCPLDCDALVMVVDCAAVETGCMLE